MKRLFGILIVILIFLSGAQCLAANRMYYATCLTGGAAGCLDAIDGNDAKGDSTNIPLAEGDGALVLFEDVVHEYYLNATIGGTIAAESSPYLIAPDTNAGNKRWVLQETNWGSSAYLVFPGTADQGVDNDLNSVKDLVDRIGTTKNATLVFAHFANLGNNTTYTFTTSETITDNIAIKVWPGAILSDGGGSADLAINGPIDVPKMQWINWTGSGAVTFGASSTTELWVEWWGAVGDGATDDSTPIQAAIDAAAAGERHSVRFMDKNYKCNVIFKDDVTLIGHSYIHGVGSAAGISRSNRTKLTANATGVIVDTPAGNIMRPAIVGIDFVGLGSSVPLVGVRFQNVTRGVIKYCSFDNIADQAIIHSAGAACNFTDIMAQNCLLDRTQSSKVGVIQIDGGTDDYLQNIEATPSLSAKSDANLYLCAFAILDPGGNHFINNCVGEFADIGFYVNCAVNRFVSCRADRNMAHGFQIDGSAGVRNIFTACLGFANSEDTTNTYDHFHCTATSSQNMFVACYGYSSQPSYGFVTRYGFYDNRTGTDNYLRHTYIGCRSLNDGTAWFYGAAGQNSSFPIDGFNATVNATDGDVTPSVLNTKLLQLNNTSSTTVTDFDDAFEGQIIYVFSDNSPTNTTIQHNGSIISTIHNTNFDIETKQTYGFIHHNGIWRQITTDTYYNERLTAKGGDSTGSNVYSANANSLGANTGFYEISPGKYVPYWTTISP